jgi:hypothetical protein
MLMEILPILMPQVFVDQFVFIWGHEQCSMRSNQLKAGTYYYSNPYKGFEMCVFYLLRTSLWQKRPNIVH